MTEHAELVARLVKPGHEIHRELIQSVCHRIHMALGIAGEAGELVDAIKKNAIYCRAIDIANVVEELGDLEFYMEGLRAELGITREETLLANIDKLNRRYKLGKYSDEQATERADKQI